VEVGPTSWHQSSSEIVLQSTISLQLPVQLSEVGAKVLSEVGRKLAIVKHPNLYGQVEIYNHYLFNFEMGLVAQFEFKPDTAQRNTSYRI